MQNQNEFQEAAQEFEEHGKLEAAVFIPCCKAKKAPKRSKVEGNNLTDEDWPKDIQKDLVGRELSEKAQSALKEGRKAMKGCIDFKSQMVPAIDLYIGKFYKGVDGAWDNVIRQMKEGWLRVFVISGCYGIIDIREPIHDYNAEMRKCKKYICKCGATHWHNKLEEIICDLLLKLKPERVFGYFCGEPEWEGGSLEKSRYFYEAGLKRALHHNSDSLNPKCAGCFHREDGPGQPALIALGKVFGLHSNENFNCRYALDLIENPYRRNDVVISYQNIPRHWDYQESLHLLQKA